MKVEKSKLIKGLTLLSFTLLISAFLLFRTGKLDAYLVNENSGLQTSPNGGALSSNQIDSSGPKMDSTRKLMFPSSKSIVLTDSQRDLLDSIKKKHKPVYYTPKETEIMSSSKSSIIFKPLEHIKYRFDTLNSDSSKRKLYRKQ